MNNKDHCKAVRLLLGQKPHPSLHSWMDELSKTLGGGHRVLRHDANIMSMAKELYGEDGEREVAFHIACDVGVITTRDFPIK